MRTAKFGAVLELLIVLASFGNNAWTFALEKHSLLDAQAILDEEKIITAYSAYLNCPSSEKAKVFAMLLPEHKMKNRKDQISSIERILEFVINTADNYFIIEKEACAGDGFAAEAIFRLTNLSDGAYSETLLITLGNLLRVNPRLFVSLLFKYGDQDVADDQIGRYATMVDDFYTDRPMAYKHELEMRVRALEQVSDEIYAKVQRACIKRLRKIIDMVEDEYYY